MWSPQMWCYSTTRRAAMSWTFEPHGALSHGHAWHMSEMIQFINAVMLCVRNLDSRVADRIIPASSILERRRRFHHYPDGAWSPRRAQGSGSSPLASTRIGPSSRSIYEGDKGGGSCAGMRACACSVISQGEDWGASGPHGAADQTWPSLWIWRMTAPCGWLLGLWVQPDLSWREVDGAILQAHWLQARLVAH